MEETHRATMTPRPCRKEKFSLLPKSFALLRKNQLEASAEEKAKEPKKQTKLFHFNEKKKEDKMTPKPSAIPVVQKTKKPLLYQVFHKKTPQAAVVNERPKSQLPRPEVRAYGKPPLPVSKFNGNNVERPNQFRPKYPSGSAPLAESESSTVDNSPSVEFVKEADGSTTVMTASTVRGRVDIRALAPAPRLSTSPQLRRHKIMPKSPLALAQQQIHDTDQVLIRHTQMMQNDSVKMENTVQERSNEHQLIDSTTNSQLEAASNELNKIMKELSTDDESLSSVVPHTRFENSATFERASTAGERPLSRTHNEKSVPTCANDRVYMPSNAVTIDLVDYQRMINEISNMKIQLHQLQMAVEAQSAMPNWSVNDILDEKLQCLENENQLLKQENASLKVELQRSRH